MCQPSIQSFQAVLFNHYLILNCFVMLIVVQFWKGEHLSPVCYCRHNFYIKKKIHLSFFMSVYIKHSYIQCYNFMGFFCLFVYIKHIYFYIDHFPETFSCWLNVKLLLWYPNCLICDLFIHVFIGNQYCTCTSIAWYMYWWWYILDLWCLVIYSFDLDINCFVWLNVCYLYM